MHAFLLALLLSGISLQDGPRHVYLTWQGPTSSTITVNAHTLAADPDFHVRYDTVPRTSGAEFARRAAGSSHQIDGLPDGRHIHWVELEDLRPNTVYYFVAGSEESGFSEQRSFRTLPADDAEIRFVAGGDLGVGEVMRRLLRRAAAEAPDFVIIGGDIAYVNGDLSLAHVWDEWLDSWNEAMVTPEGHMIPMVLAVGNHEVQGGYLGGKERAPFYFGYFAQPERRSYFRQRFGANLALYVLDSGHVVDHADQVAWLDEVMADDEDVTHRFAIYHIPLYPSHREYDGSHSLLGRQYWQPVFDRYGLDVGFENHDHTFKRSKRIRGGEAHSDGTLYLGDGSFGRGDRTIDLTQPWYLDRAGSVRHFWVVDLSSSDATFRAVDLSGRTFDVYPTDAEGAEAARAYFRTLTHEYEMAGDAVTVAALTTSFEDFDAETVTVRVSNTEGYPALVDVRAVVDDALRVEPEHLELDLAPGASRDLQFELRAERPLTASMFPAAYVEADFAFAREKGSDVDTIRIVSRERIAVERDFSAPRRVGTITIDGRLDEWASLPYVFDAPAGGAASLDAAEASLRFAVSYDAERVYAAFEVTDDDVVTKPGTPLWDAADEEATQDALLVWLDPHPGGEGDDDPYFVIGPGGEVVAGDSDWAELAASVRAAAERRNDGYSIELAVPRSALGGPAEQEGVRLNLALTDVDQEGSTRELLFWRPQWESPEDFGEFGVVRFSADEGSE